MNILDTFFNKLDELPLAKLQKGIILLCSGAFLAALLCVFKNRYDQLQLVEQAKKSIASLNKINGLLAKKAQIEQEKEAAAKLLESVPSKDLLKVIESCAQEGEVELDEGYKTRLKTVAIPQEPNFVEQQTVIISDKLNLKKIITLINSLRNENFVMFRELAIENKGKVPSFQLLLSMRQKK